jgi:23S rRNA-/tRNA-specific pseudouridylate synthase
MKYLNHPVVCDSLYNPTGSCPLGFSRLALHAKAIEFHLFKKAGSLEGETLKVESTLPKEFKKLIEE